MITGNIFTYIRGNDRREWKGRKFTEKHQRQNFGGKRRRTLESARIACGGEGFDFRGIHTLRPDTSVDQTLEQHRRIRQVYSANRPRSINVRLRDRERRREQADAEIEAFEDRRGYEKCRPQSSIMSQKSISCKLQRPASTGYLSNVSSTLQPYIAVREDPSLGLERIREKAQATEIVREQWTPEKHDLTSRKFITHPSMLGVSLQPKKRNAWVTFSGAVSDEPKCINAFTTCGEDEIIYHIESAAGSAVAQRLMTGENVRIGVNGQIKRYPGNSSQSLHDATGNKWEVASDDQTNEIHRRRLIPLSWRDQLSFPGVVLKDAVCNTTLHKNRDHNARFSVKFEKFFTTPQPRLVSKSVQVETYVS